MPQLPRWMFWSLLAGLLVSWVPFALVGKARATKSPRPPVHFVPDMDDQPRYETQEQNLLFADTRAMRPPPEGTVAVGELEEDTAFHTGKVGEGWIEGYPIEIDGERMARGQERFDVYCAPCHGQDGGGNGIVNVRATRLEEGTWAPPTDLRSELVRGRAEGHLFNTVTHGIRNMPAYGKQIPIEDRWAIVAYMRALQRARGASLDDVPESRRDGLR
jgi:mono/diheme cytochrome c family protein